MSITINPALTTNAQGSFDVQTDGYIQGTALDQPAARYSLAGGVLHSTATLPMWGGIAISEQVPGAVPGPSAALGGIIDRATNVSAVGAALSITGFSVFDQNYSAINSPQSPVPLAAAGMQVNFYRLGSGARIAVKCDPNLIAADGHIVTAPVSWDFANQQLTTYASASVSSGTYDNATGAVSLTTGAAHGLQPGDTFIPVLTGTGSVANLNFEQVATAGTTGSTLNFTAATGLTLTISGGTVATGGALPVRVLDVQDGNSMTVTYDAATGFATWDRSGTCAIILI